MLTLTGDAASAIRDITTQPGLPEDTGIRIASSASNDGGPAFEIAVASAPQPADQVVEADGARVFLDPDASAALSDKALDAEVSEGTIRFRIEDRSS